jgi:hypothetical protein
MFDKAIDSLNVIKSTYLSRIDVLNTQINIMKKMHKENDLAEFPISKSQTYDPKKGYHAKEASDQSPKEAKELVWPEGGEF